MLHREDNIREIEDRKFYTVDAVVVTEKIEWAAFVREV